MYQLKQIPQDFVVKEISNIELKDNGDYSYFLLKKKDYNTLRAAEHIAEKLKIPLKWIGFCGNKDKNALTEQMISIKGCNLKEMEMKDIKLIFVGKNDKPLSLGSHSGNYFEITIRNLNSDEVEKLKSKKIMFPNYFGEQRFSKGNADIGKAIVKGDFKSAVSLIGDSNKQFKGKSNTYLEKHKNDYIGTIKQIPLKLLRMYVHAYQSLLFNRAAEYLKMFGNDANVDMPLIGFGTDIKDKNIKKIIDDIMKKEEITYRDFIIRKFPELSSDGGNRKLFETAKDFKILLVGEDELNEGMKKVIVSFNLDKGAYATEFIRYIFS